MKRFFFFILPVLVMCCSCSPQYRLSRLLKKHPELSKEKAISYVDSTFIDSCNLSYTQEVGKITTVKADSFNIEIWGTHEDSIKWFNAVNDSSCIDTNSILLIVQKSGIKLSGIKGSSVLSIKDNRNLNVDVKLPSDTIVQDKQITVPIAQVKYTFFDLVKDYWFVIFILAILLILLKHIFKR